ncbi:MAG: hypothetical protein H6709_11180 [Kofleriaceae bacterium]|nr:hypothetical protein [Kofleriaceae bacterium]MCB9572637.1 hypothetical protein [Kofleriaceae bacterium]
MTRTLTALALMTALASAACVSEEVTPDEQLGTTSAALTAPDQINQPRIDKSIVVTSAVQYGLSWSARAESNAWNWSWKGQGGFTASEFNWYGNYGYCTSYSWGNRCNSSLDTWFITPGWGANFKNYWGQQSPGGWSTFGQHPYWCPNQTVGDGNAVNNTWQGWSTTNHCGGAS